MEWLWLPHVRRLSAIKAPITAVTDLVESNLANLLVTLAIKVLLYVVVTAILLLREMNVSTRTDLSRQFKMLKRSRRAEAGLR